jgi:hypothetical protein
MFWTLQFANVYQIYRHSYSAIRLVIGPSAIRPAPSHYVTCAAHLTLTEPPIREATWIARVTVITATERLFGSRPGEDKPWLV